MNDDEMAELLKYSSSNELYIVNGDNVLKRLKCPFLVIVLHPIYEFERKDILTVEQVKITKELKTVYIIMGKSFLYKYFDIIDFP